MGRTGLHIETCLAQGLNVLLTKQTAVLPKWELLFCVPGTYLSTLKHVSSAASKCLFSIMAPCPEHSLGGMPTYTIAQRSMMGRWTRGLPGVQKQSRACGHLLPSSSVGKGRSFQQEAREQSDIQMENNDPPPHAIHRSQQILAGSQP